MNSLPTMAVGKYKLARVKTFFRDNSPAMNIEVICEGDLQLPVVRLQRDGELSVFPGRLDTLGLVSAMCKDRLGVVDLGLELTVRAALIERMDPFTATARLTKELYYNLKATNLTTGRRVGAADAQGTHWSYDLQAAQQAQAGALTLPIDGTEKFLVSDRIFFSIDVKD